MSKSKGNFLTIDDIQGKNIDPVAIRLFFMQAHYRQEMNFVWEAVQAAHNSLMSLRQHVLELKKTATTDYPPETEFSNVFREAFRASLSDDLNTAKSLAVLWNVVRAEMEPGLKLKLLFEFDDVLGLNLPEVKEETIPDEIKQFAEDREQARTNKDFAKSDELRKQIEEQGFLIEDTQQGYIIKKK